MSLVTTGKLVEEAHINGKCVPAFNVGSMEMVRGAVKAAEELNVPIIIQIAERLLKYSPLELMGPMMVQAARESRVDIAVNMDHCRDLAVMKRALDYGFTGVMYDGSTDPYEDNIRGTIEAVKLASSYGASTEGELGAGWRF